MYSQASDCDNHASCPLPEPSIFDSLHPGMVRTSLRRSTRTRLLRALLLVATAVFLIDLFSLASLRLNHAPRAPAPNVHGQKIFIASIHWNNEAVLRSNWNRAVRDLVEYFGPESVYVSIHESGSWDDSKGALRELEQSLKELRVNQTVSLDEATHADELRKQPTTGWIDTPRGRKELRRIPYLSRLRNRSLQPLWELAEQDVKFDKVLFLNDVVFTVCLDLPPTSRFLYIRPFRQRPT